MIDLRSDTLTRPTPAMRDAIAAAEVGDEQKGEDPTVNALAARGAELLGQESAIFVPSATMANQIALRVLGEPGEELLADPRSHVFLYELGGPAVHSGLVMKPVGSGDGEFSSADVDAAFAGAAWYHSSSRVLAIENTHAESGGRAWDSGRLRSVVSHGRDLGLRVHLDGARLLNAAVAGGTTPADIATHFDTVTLCLSKGLGCPVGALLAGSADVIGRARRWKQLFGGAMRQAGIIAAAGLFALEHNVERLADDHRHARLLAQLLADAHVPLADQRVDSNMVLVDVRVLGIDADAAVERLHEAGVRLSTVSRPGILRAVTHLDVDEAAIREAAARISAALCARAAPEPATPGGAAWGR